MSEDIGFSILEPFVPYDQCTAGALPAAAALCLWTFGALYLFLAIAIICDDYFVASLEAITEALQLSDDVAGATFMAAGSSAPELFTSVTGVFFVKKVKEDNAGPGTIIGSAVFNIAVIIGGSVVCAGRTLELDWWPLARDGSFYAFSIIVLWLSFVVITPHQIDWWEGLSFVGFYGVYCYLMKRNPEIVDWLQARYGGEKTEMLDAEMQPAVNEGAEAPLTENPEATTTAQITRKRGSSLLVRQYENRPHLTKHTHEGQQEGAEHGEQENDDYVRAQATAEPQAADPEAPQGGSENAADDGDDDDEGMPDGCLKATLWVVSLPLQYLFKYTVPDCNKKRWEKWYALTFIMSIWWIAVISYLMVEFGIKMGRCLNLSTSVMGLTVLAAGTSVPDALSSFLVARMGRGNMAVSNAIGSNVFDILLGLGFPWFLSGAIVRRTSLPIDTSGVRIYVLMLFMVLAIFLGLVRLSGWRLQMWQGAVLFLVYIGYAVVALLIDVHKA